MLHIEHLTCGYGRSPILQDVSFHVREGEQLCILGPNGCGKTTLLRAIAGLLPYEGKIEMGGDDLRRLSPRKRAQKLALMSQLEAAAFDYTVYETVMLGRYAHQKGGLLADATDGDCRTVEESMRLSGVWDLKDRLVTELSGGQLQRVFLARTFAQEPQAILLDEPTNHLDLHCQAELLDSLRAWSTVGGRCVVGVLHDINLALNFADTVLLLNLGNIAAYERIDKFDLSLLNALYEMDVGGYMRESLKRWI